MPAQTSPVPERPEPPPAGPTLFFLSPANLTGVRAGYLLNSNAAFPLALQFHSTGLPLEAVFSFTSGLYFRGKIAYARHFAKPDQGDEIRIITSNAGLQSPDRIVGPEEIAAFGKTAIDSTDPAYTGPLLQHALELAQKLGPNGKAVLLGSIATPKYREVLLSVFGERLVFPVDFVGRGDMSRGALLLRSVSANIELTYGSVASTKLTGQRAPRAAIAFKPSAPPE